VKLSSLPVRLARSAINAAAGDRVHVVRILSGPARGRRLSLELAQEKAYWLGVYERPVQQILCEVLRPGDLFYDVGAHVGFFSVCAAALGARVVAVEPDAANAARLRVNAALNGFEVRVVEAAAWSESGSVSLERGDSPKEGRVAPGTGVRAVVIDELVEAEGAPVLIKLDVEGAEVEALRGAQRTLERDRPVVLCELHGDAARQEVAALLDGYRVEEVEGPTRILARPR
jgi:FkbM family methyltransferase